MSFEDVLDATVFGEPVPVSCEALGVPDTDSRCVRVEDLGGDAPHVPALVDEVTQLTETDLSDVVCTERGAGPDYECFFFRSIPGDDGLWDRLYIVVDPEGAGTGMVLSTSLSAFGPREIAGMVRDESLIDLGD